MKKIVGRSCLFGLTVMFAWASCVPLVFAQAPVNLNFLSESGVRAYRLLILAVRRL